MLDDRVCFTLANGQEWQICASAEAAAMVATLKRLMRLRPCSSANPSRLCLVRGDLTIEDPFVPDLSSFEALQGLQAIGWAPFKLGPVRLWKHPSTSDVVCEVGPCHRRSQDIMSLSQAMYPVYDRVIQEGGLPAHAAFVEYKGHGVLISAPSDTGKTTCYRRIGRPWRRVCDDEVAIVKASGGYRVHPFPTWADYVLVRSRKTWDVSRHLPLSAIFFLEQGACDSAEPEGKGAGSLRIDRSAYQIHYRFLAHLDKERAAAENRRLFVNSCEVAREVPIFRLKATLTGQFWTEMERALKGTI